MLEDIAGWLMPAWQALPLAFRDVIASSAMVVSAALAGRMLWHVRQVQYRHRRFFSANLCLELITAVCVGWAADGVANWLELTGKPAIAFIIVVSYIGPGGLEHLFWKVADRWVAKA